MPPLSANALSGGTPRAAAAPTAMLPFRKSRLLIFIFRLLTEGKNYPKY
jgi:hypothetical protein